MSINPAYKTALVTYPNEGPKNLELRLAFPASGALPVQDLFEEMASNEIASIQSVFIDNSDNSSAFTLTFPGIRNGYTISVQPYHQGWYPVAAAHGTLQFTAVSAANDNRTIIFSNVMVPYFDWGPVSGVLVVPALVQAVIDASQVGDGTQVLVAPQPGKVIKMYRLQFTVDNPCTVQFKDSGGTALTGKITLFAGGSITWQASGVPWISSPAGLGINLVFTNTGGATIVIGGLEGYTAV